MRSCLRRFRFGHRFVLSVVVDIIDVDGIGPFGRPSEGDAPVLFDRDRVLTGAITFQTVEAAARAVHVFRPRRGIEFGENEGNLFDVVSFQTASVVVELEPPECLRFKVPDPSFPPSVDRRNVKHRCTYVKLYFTQKAQKIPRHCWGAGQRYPPPCLDALLPRSTPACERATFTHQYPE